MRNSKMRKSVAWLLTAAMMFSAVPVSAEEAPARPEALMAEEQPAAVSETAVVSDALAAEEPEATVLEPEAVITEQEAAVTESSPAEGNTGTSEELLIIEDEAAGTESGAASEAGTGSETGVDTEPGTDAEPGTEGMTEPSDQPVVGGDADGLIIDEEVMEDMAELSDGLVTVSEEETLAMEELLRAAADSVVDTSNPAYSVVKGSYEPGTYTVTANLFVPRDLNPLFQLQAYLTNPDNPLKEVDDNDPAQVTGTVPNTHVSSNATLVVGEDDTLTLILPVRNPVFTLQKVGTGDNLTIAKQEVKEGSYKNRTSRIYRLTILLENSLTTYDGAPGYRLMGCEEYPTLLDQTWNVPLDLTVDFGTVPKKEAYQIKEEPKVQSNLVYTGVEQQGVLLPEHCQAVEGQTSAVNAGAYRVKVTPEDGYAWADGSTAVKEYEWSIAKAKLKTSLPQEMEYQPYDITQYPSVTKILNALEITGFVNGETAEAVDGCGRITAVMENKVPAPMSSCLYTLSLPELTNYKWDNATKLYVRTGMRPENEPKVREDVYYNGTEQYGFYSPEDPSVPYGQTEGGISSDTMYWLGVNGGSAKLRQTEAGTYSVEIVPSLQTAWADGTRTARTYTWTLHQAPLKLEIDDCTVTCGNTPEITAHAVGFAEGESEETAAGYTAPAFVIPDKLEAGKSYEITAEGGSADNYYFSEYGNATLTVLAEGTAKKPRAKTLTYVGKERTFVELNAAYQIENNVGKNAGTYEVTVTLNDGYTWEDGSEEKSIQLEFTIKKATLHAVFVTEAILNNMEPALEIEVTGFAEGESVETASGYVAPRVDKPENKGGPVWSIPMLPYGGEADNYDFVYEEGRLIQWDAARTVRTPLLLENLVYNGLEQSGFVTYEGSSFTNTTAVDAGDYTAEFVRDADKSFWVDDNPIYGLYLIPTEATRQYNWSIAKAPLKASYVSETIEYGETPALEIAVEGFVNGEAADTAAGYQAPQLTAPEKLLPGTYELTPAGGNAKNYEFTEYMAGTLTVTAKETAIPSAITGLTYNGAEQTGVAAGAGYTLTGTVKATEAGTYTARAILREGYVWPDNTTSSVTVRWSIAAKKVNKPTAAVLSYNGKTQTGVKAGEGYTLSGTVKAAKAGTYTAAAALQKNYIWSDGSSANASVKWSIGKGQQSIKTKKASQVYKVTALSKKADSFQIGASASGKLSYKVTRTPGKSASRYISVKNGKVTMRKGAPAGTYQVTVSAAATANYKAAARVVTIKVNRVSQTIKAKVSSKSYKASALKKKAATFQIGASAKGKLSYKVSGYPKNGKKYITVSKSGKVTMKKNTPKGTYKITVTAAQNGNCAKAVKTIKIVVK